MQLELQNIKKSYGEGGSRIEVLKDISLGVEKGEFVVLLGPSGSGKSTLLNIIGGIDSADSGKIVIRGKSMSDMDEKALTSYRRDHLGYIFQMYNLKQMMSGWIVIWLDPSVYIKMFLLGIVTYAIVAVIEYRKIGLIPMSEALKNVE